MRALAVFFVVFIAGCACPLCGDGICQGGDERCPETDKTCPADCPTGESLMRCERDTDCVPLPSECHPIGCINAEFSGNFESPSLCTEIFMYEAAYTKLDCWCEDGFCVNRNIGRTVLE